MALSTKDLFARPQELLIGGQLSAIFKDDPRVEKSLTAAEKSAIKAVMDNVGSPEEYPSSAEYILRALPFVKSVYSKSDVIQPALPSNQDLAIMMRSRFIK